MAGRGPQPKQPGTKAGHSRDSNPASTIEFVGADQPPLPEGEGYPEWHPQTVKWWAMWGRSPQAVHFMETDWDSLLDTAVMHTAMWGKGQWTLAAELRLRVAKYGATPEDRLRLRMHFADADEKDAKRPQPPQSSRDRYAGLKVVSE